MRKIGRNLYREQKSAMTNFMPEMYGIFEDSLARQDSTGLFQLLINRFTQCSPENEQVMTRATATTL
jgi:hypothetical protein